MHHIKYFHSSMHSPYENKYIIYITHIALITKISQVISLPLSQLLSPFHSQTQGCIPEALNISLPLKLSSLSSLSFNHISPPLSSIAKKGHTKHKGCLRFKLCTNLSPFVSLKRLYLSLVSNSKQNKYMGSLAHEQTHTLTTRSYNYSSNSGSL